MAVAAAFKAATNICSRSKNSSLDNDGSLKVNATLGRLLSFKSSSKAGGEGGIGGGCNGAGVMGRKKGSTGGGGFVVDSGDGGCFAITGGGSIG